MASHAGEEKKTPFLTNETYDFLNNLVKIILPGVGALYFAIAAIWGLPYSEQVVGTIAALSVFLGLWLTVLKGKYDNSSAKFDGAIQVDTSDPAKDTYSILLEKPLADLNGASQVTLQVQNVEPPSSQ